MPAGLCAVHVERELPHFVQLAVWTAAVAAVHQKAAAARIEDRAVIDAGAGSRLTGDDFHPLVARQIERPGVVQIQAVFALAAEDDGEIAFRVVHGGAVPALRRDSLPAGQLRPAPLSFR